ncbi:MAG: DUF1837 domain-containing protein, partial [Deltaproteobacteria bacterium]|nr:DUF1837 domain-containing protein [Deltaproteobacteria bacterium]
EPGATMAGDFGEILVYLYQSVRELPVEALGVKKWRLKQDRTKPAPHSDVVHFVLPSWPMPSDKDVLLCSEVKTKSTDGDSTPIQSAIADSEKDRKSLFRRSGVRKVSIKVKFSRSRAIFHNTLCVSSLLVASLLRDRRCAQ